MNPNLIRFGILGLIVGGATALGYFLLRDPPKERKDKNVPPVANLPPPETPAPGAAPVTPVEEPAPNAQ